LSPEDPAACHAEMNRHYEALHGVLCEGPYDGVREMLAALRSADVPLGIVTGKGAHAWEVTRRALDLGEFAVVVREEDVPEPKPHPAGLRAALNVMGLEAADTVYVGDSLSDMEAGRAAGMRIGAALWAKTDPADRDGFLRDVERWNPDWLFERPADVTRMFVPWC
jgi:phosphoglycolate phosphatase/pyrophosphatase PpaX